MGKSLPPDPPGWDSLSMPQDPDPTGLKAMVGLHKELWDAYRAVGFTRSEATDLTCMAVTVMAMEPDDPDA